MKIPTTAELSPLLKHYGIDEQKTLPQKIMAVYCLKESESSKIKEFEKSISNISSTILKKEDLIGNINRISKKYGADSIIRLKNGNFKPGKSDNLMKKLINGRRYEAERISAARFIGDCSDNTTASKGQQFLSDQLTKEKQDVDALNDQKEKAKKQYVQLNHLESMLRNQPCASKPKEDEKRGENKDNIKIRRDFNLIYQTNVGCAALNSKVRDIYIYGNSSNSNPTKVSGVIDEYERTFGSGIFEKGNKELKKDIDYLSENIDDLVVSAAKAFYTPSEDNITTMRGCGMTKNGIAELFKGKKNNTTYKLSQFFSTTSDKNIANKFAEANSGDDKAKVLFTVKGNSSNPVIVKDGLQFGNNEREKLYSPLAHFVVTHASKSGDNYRFTLQEVSKARNAEVFPH
ncbi:hypothetical protein HYO34_12135 [Vibrio parahaemolyticus]|nr:hypothetical protein [Vibrio parahaemolyticus]